MSLVQKNPDESTTRATAAVRVGFVLFAALALLSACRQAQLGSLSDSRIPLAVLGDSDSHAYQDTLSFPEGSGDRGGPYRATALQWTEVLDRIRHRQVDQGAWGEWGTRGRWSRLAAWFGIDLRSPPKQDFQFNFAWSGAKCADLSEGHARQTNRLLAVMDETTARWRNGVVVIRIGINDLGHGAHLAEFAVESDSLRQRARVDACLTQVRSAVDLISSRHPQVAFLLVGVLNNADTPTSIGRWKTLEERQNIARVLDRYDAGLRLIASGSGRRAFFDDRAFFERNFGSRRADGSSGYRGVDFGFAPDGTAMRSEFREGNAPTVLFLRDGHMGTSLNAIWAQAITETLKTELGFEIEPISDDELKVVLSPLFIDAGKITE